MRAHRAISANKHYQVKLKHYSVLRDIKLSVKPRILQKFLPVYLLWTEPKLETRPR